MHLYIMFQHNLCIFQHHAYILLFCTRAISGRQGFPWRFSVYIHLITVLLHIETCLPNARLCNVSNQSVIAEEAALVRPVRQHEQSEFYLWAHMGPYMRETDL